MASGQLHPLVLVNITDHYTRVNNQKLINGHASKVFGVLFGTVQVPGFEILDSIEVDVEHSKLQVADVKSRIELHAKVYPNRIPIGWYTSGNVLDASYLNMHQQMMQVMENPMFLLLKDEDLKEESKVPVAIYDSEVHVVEDTPTRTFVNVPYTIKTMEVEQIAMDYIAKIKPDTDNVTTLTNHVEDIVDVVGTLKTKLLECIKYVKEHPEDVVMRRKIAQISTNLPMHVECEREMGKEYNDALMVNMLASMTKGNYDMHEIVEKFTMADARQKRRCSMI